MSYKNTFFFDKPPFRLLAKHLAKDEDFLADARFVLTLEEHAFLRFAVALEKSDAFISRAVLDTMTDEALTDKVAAAKLAKIIYKIAEILHDADMPVGDATDMLCAALAEDENPFTREEKQRLHERLRRLVAAPAGFARQFKAQKLAVATGGELDQLQIICDIRPIFDANRTTVEGALPLAVLRLDYTAPDGESKALEVRANERLIDALETTAAAAKRKMGAMRELLKKQNIPVPSTTAAP